MRTSTNVAGVVVMCGLAVGLSGCCSNEDKQDVQKFIDKNIQQMEKRCEKIVDATRKDECYQKVNDAQAQANSLYIAYVTACDNNEKTLAEQILKQIQELFKKNAAVSAGQAGIVNEQPVLGDGSEVCFAITSKARKSSDAKPLVKVNGKYFTPESAGLALLDTNAQPSVAVMSAQAASGITTTFEIDSQSTACFDDGSELPTVSVSVSGTMSFAAQPSSALGGSQFVPTDLTLEFTHPLATFVAKLDPSCKFNNLQIDSYGNGVLEVQASVEWKSDTIARPSTLHQLVWLKLPVQANADFSTLAINTGGMMAGKKITPRLPYPVADANEDYIVDAADYALFMGWYTAADPRADAVRDGTINTSDLEYFDKFWQLDAQ